MLLVAWLLVRVRGGLEGRIGPPDTAIEATQPGAHDSIHTHNGAGLGPPVITAVDGQEGGEERRRGGGQELEGRGEVRGEVEARRWGRGRRERSSEGKRERGEEGKGRGVVEGRGRSERSSGRKREK
ncbi:hypothetical protein Pmani_030742 [Petrolisthes manimaculis]|uniref:Uncharacterized protein n=1 Tax=Petrolisthes manimaculis TaxID=1843537 RepID=A0AAE1NWS1_9EUCA|nr:hypothetical protein Pmani_030742 [Petrolisthes manimaculis]